MAEKNPGLAVGLTGGIACGKSEVAKIMESEGFCVKQADSIAHDLMKPGQDVYERIAKVFGDSIMKENGEIDRKLLGKVVFEDNAALKTLNNLVHSNVQRIYQTWVQQMTENGCNVVVELPLLYEIGETQMWDLIICVTAPEDIVYERLLARNLSEREAHARIAAQIPLKRKVQAADSVIKNEGTLKDLRKQTLKVIRMLKTKERNVHA